MNYPEDKPFGEWSPEQQRDFLIRVRVDAKEYQTKTREMLGWARGLDVEKGVSPLLDIYYRLAPEPETDDSIDWSHVHPDFIVLVKRNGFATIRDEHGREVDPMNFASYKRGNKPSSTVYRPGFEPEAK